MVESCLDAVIVLFAVDVDELSCHHKIDGMLKVLSGDEQARAARYQFEQLRDRFVSGRFFLRTVLGELTNVRPNLIKFELGSNGKPAIARSQCSEGHFSYSRSAQYSVCCFSNRGRVGIDLELQRKVSDIDLMAAEIFCEDELACWRTLSASQKQAAFYQNWTRKEAVAKVGGRGISDGLTDIKVPFGRLDHAQAVIVDACNTSTNEYAAPSNSILLSDWHPFADVTSSVAIETPFMDALELQYSDVASRDYLGDDDFPVESLQRSFSSASTLK